MMRRPHIAWWLESGATACTFREVRYRIEAMTWCHDCDHPACRACIFEIPASREMFCPECLPATETVRLVEGAY